MIGIINDPLGGVDGRAAAQGDQHIRAVHQNVGQTFFDNIRGGIRLHIRKNMVFDARRFEHIRHHLEQAEFNHAFVGNDANFLIALLAQLGNGANAVPNFRLHLKLANRVHFAHYFPFLFQLFYRFDGIESL